MDYCLKNLRYKSGGDWKDRYSTLDLGAALRNAILIVLLAQWTRDGHGEWRRDATWRFWVSQNRVLIFFFS